ncbi:MAG TPA: heavy metal sensor histidine kinase [Burkholderiales bacterium]|nr:heavy metal sensor histidine kinase [Burkholderiales bacterium]
MFKRSGKWRSMQRPLSITARLTLLYTISALIILSASSAYLYITLDNYLKHKEALAVRDQVILLRHMLSEVNDPAVPLSRARKWEERGVENRRFQSRILDENQRILAESPDMQPPAGAFPRPSDDSAMLTTASWTAASGSSYVLMSAWGKSGRAPEQKKIIQVAIERSASAALLEDFRETLLIVLAIGFVLTAIVANWTARRGMAPLHNIAAAARRISASQLHERLQGSPWPRELEELGAAFDGMLQRLEDSFTRLSQFSSDLAHELRTPITNLMGEAEVALSRVRDAGEYRSVVESSLEEYERLSRMIDSLLFLAQADSPRAQIQKMELDVPRELDDIRDFYKALADERGVSLCFEGKAAVQADPILFRRAISNLISNAMRYTPRGGRITVHTSAPEGSVDVAVRDSGSGIPPHHLPRIFDRFYRADPARSNYSEGTGLGLAIVKSIMTLHDGTVSAESAAGNGSTLTLHFPPGVGDDLAPNASRSIDAAASRAHDSTSLATAVRAD